MRDGVGEVYGLVDGYELMDVEREPWTGAMVSCVPVNRVVVYDFDDGGTTMQVSLTNYPDVARSLLGRRVRVTVEVLDD